MTTEFNIKTPQGELKLAVAPGETLYFVGANGAGKSRLAAAIEEQLGERVHRVAAHRALALDLKVPKINRKEAESSLFTGRKDGNITLRPRSRWGQRKNTHLLNDFGALLQVLFAEQNDTALKTHKAARNGDNSPPEKTFFEQLTEVWEKLIQHRNLSMTGDSISVTPHDGGNSYSAEEMSDGERAVFYLIGQVLCARPDSLVIFDEPEIHIHRSILSKLWDELQALRSDCGFLLISHDLEFVASRSGSKYVIEAFESPETWTLNEVPTETDFSEELTTLILGSRRPILFVEGTVDSLDVAIYRAVYFNWTVIPRGGCAEVISSVRTMKANDGLTRVKSAGIVDADDRTPEEILKLNQDGIYPLSVSELENVILNEKIANAICKLEAFDASETATRIASLKEKVFVAAACETSKDAAVMRHVQRRIDREMKSIKLTEAKTPQVLASAFSTGVAAIDVVTIAQKRQTEIDKAVTNRDLATLLTLYDDKGLLAIAGTELTGKSKKKFERWIARQLRQNAEFRNAFETELPALP